MSRGALADAEPAVFWLDRPDRPELRAPLPGRTDADLLVMGGGYSGHVATGVAALGQHRGPTKTVSARTPAA